MSEIEHHPLREYWRNCTGCGACAAECPKDCIRLYTDERVRPRVGGYPLNPRIHAANEASDLGAPQAGIFT